MISQRAKETGWQTCLVGVISDGVVDVVDLDYKAIERRLYIMHRSVIRMK